MLYSSEVYVYTEGHRESATTTASQPWGCFLTVLYLVGMIGKCGDQRKSMMETIKKHLKQHVTTVMILTYLQRKVTAVTADHSKKKVTHKEAGHKPIFSWLSHLLAGAWSVPETQWCYREPLGTSVISSNPGPILQVIFSTQLKPLLPRQTCSLDFKASTKISNELISKYQEPEKFISKT